MDCLLSFDDMNKLGIKRRSVPYTEYFEPMDLTDEQKEERESFSEDTEDKLLFALILLALLDEYGVSEPERIQQVTETLTMEFTGVIERYTTIDDHLRSYAEDFSATFVETTIENISEAWFMSEDRVMFDSENEANTVLNYKDYIRAIASGYTKKEWVTFKDNRVRKTHKVLDGKTIGITNLFEVGNTFMAYPKDLAHGAANHPESYINCRCTVHFHK